ncbi:hypothetical protein PORY_001020 [Pneumocystis oryctolagi]|uniref:Uncharacterized protein n=1 Tax=Pneumocystis oryctolagi TaxID=42067 RepID=A0ACB7CIE4_9ASCO|nr:hypothetical protein PORY_001020 [Pneumocystis oryctolagi]
MQSLRRSDRANKGHRSQIFEDAQIPMNERVQCACGEDDGGIMVQCEACTTWQHILCMGFQNEQSLPETYFCGECRPELYPKLQKGQRIKNSAKKNKTRIQDKKGNILPKKIENKDEKDVVDEKSNKETSKEPLNESINSHTTNFTAEEENSDSKQKTPSPVSTSDSDYHFQDEQVDIPPTKISRVSLEQSHIKALHNRKLPLSSKQSKKMNVPLTRQLSNRISIEDPVEKLEKLKDATRKHVAQSFLTIFTDAIKNLREEGNFVLDVNKTAEELGEHLALTIEYSMFKNFSIEEKGRYILTPKYKERFRTLHFNLKDDKNPQLRARVVSGKITPQDLVHMTSEEMANSEIQLLAESVRAQSTKNSVLKQTEAPRIRRTHKGEEIIGDQEISGFPIQQKIETSIPFSLKHKNESEKNQEEASTSSQSLNSIHKKTSSIPKINKPDPEEDSIQSDKKSASKESFDIQNVWSNVKSQKATYIPEKYPIIQTQETSGTDFDPDIDRMINDDNDSTNTPPYSPSYDTIETNIIHPIWSGKLFMASVAEFNVVATQVAGPSLSIAQSWREILQDKIIVDGRISVDKSTEYLCQQRYSSTKQLIVISFKPQSKEMQHAFERLYHYFYSRKRYGVLKPTTSAVKDAYIIPLSPTDQLPEFIQLMDDVHISEEKRTEKYILGVFIVNKTSNLPPVNKIPYTSQGTNEWKELNNTPLMHQPINVPTPLISPLPTIPILGGLTLPNNISLSSADIAVLQSVLNANPEILSNPELASNSKLLQQLVIQHQNQQNQINTTHSSDSRPMTSRWDKRW